MPLRLPEPTGTRLALAALVLALPLPALAQSAEAIKITAFRQSSASFWEIVVQGTVKDQELVCGLQNAAGDFVASDTTYADAMVTTVLIRYQGADVASAVCVPNQ